MPESETGRAVEHTLSRFHFICPFETPSCPEVPPYLRKRVEAARIRDRGETAYGHNGRTSR